LLKAIGSFLLYLITMEVFFTKITEESFLSFLDPPKMAPAFRTMFFDAAICITFSQTRVDIPFHHNAT